jgi:hypothetical protein
LRVENPLLVHYRFEFRWLSNLPQLSANYLGAVVSCLGIGVSDVLVLALALLKLESGLPWLCWSRGHVGVGEANLHQGFLAIVSQE